MVEAMTYIKVSWNHDDPSYPVLLFSELDADRKEMRKVEVFMDGSLAWADSSQSKGCELGEAAVPSIDEIGQDPQFTPMTIGREEFEIEWQRAKCNDG